MLQRQYLDERCCMNDPGRVRNESRNIRDENPTKKIYKKLSNQKIELQSPYFPQPGDDLPAEDEGPMKPVGPWATGRPVFSPTSGLTGLRPVVDRYSITRYSPAQWRAHNQTFFNQSTKTIVDARSVKANVRQNNARIYQETDKNQLENRDRLSKRASVIHQWKTVLNEALLEVTNEIELLEGEYRRVKQSLSILTIPESIAGEFLQIRNIRLEPDLVRDNVENELINEVALCSEVRNTLVKNRELIELQMSELKATKNRLEFDLTDKIDAYEIESSCIGLTNDSPLILMQPGATRVPADQSTLTAYENFTKEGLENNEEARQRSIALRSTLNDIYLKVVRELRDQAIRVDAALAEKINLTDQICQELEKELTKCLQEISDTEQLIEELRGSSKGLIEAIKVAQTRLNNRLERKNIENCRDESQFGLIEEVKILNENLSTMGHELKHAEETQAGLVKSRSDLEREILVKKKSLYVDRNRGQFLRSFYPTAEALSGHI
ncbi:hypothetical protein PV326_002110 [Microctonus aethiopoides]|nr:hypothetical protein PV326_002110 [Microctonus aethiopoides]